MVNHRTQQQLQRQISFNDIHYSLCFSFLLFKIIIIQIRFISTKNRNIYTKEIIFNTPSSYSMKIMVIV